jgi:hypothetical protein
MEEMRNETRLELTWDQAIARALATTEARQWLDKEIRSRAKVAPPPGLGGYAHPREIANEGRVYFLRAMNDLVEAADAADDRNYPVRRFFIQLHSLWRCREYRATYDELGDILHGINYADLCKWARRWGLVDANGQIPGWVIEQVGAAAYFWQLLGEHGLAVQPRWPVIVADFHGWPALDPEEQQRAEQFCRQHPDFMPLLVQNRQQWRQYRKYARLAGMRPAPWVPYLHFLWSARFQVAQEPIAVIADNPLLGVPDQGWRKRQPGFSRQDVSRAVGRVLALIGLQRRKEARDPIRHGS